MRSIHKLVRLKEIHLSLVKVKGHSGILWNEIADHLARQGSELSDQRRCITSLPPVQSVEMYWKDKKIEQPGGDFVKVLMNLKVGLEWHLSESVFKEKPQDGKLKFKWSLLWNRIKRQSGIRCTSTRKNRRL